MNVKINSSDKNACEAYKRIIELAYSYFPAGIQNVELNIEIEKSVFICYIEYRRRITSVEIGKISDIEEEKEGEGIYTRFKIKEERYAPTLLRYLWGKFGREKVEQKSRKEIILKEKVEDIERVILEKPEEDLETLWSFINYIIPEGFRIWYKKGGKDWMLIVASEDRISKDLIKEACDLYKV